MANDEFILTADNEYYDWQQLCEWADISVITLAPCVVAQIIHKPLLAMGGYDVTAPADITARLSDRVHVCSCLSAGRADIGVFSQGDQLRQAAVSWAPSPPPSGCYVRTPPHGSHCRQRWKAFV